MLEHDEIHKHNKQTTRRLEVKYAWATLKQLQLRIVPNDSEQHVSLVVRIALPRDYPNKRPLNVYVKESVRDGIHCYADSDIIREDSQVMS